MIYDCVTGTAIKDQMVISRVEYKVAYTEEDDTHMPAILSSGL
jgi:hypothetical protein